MVEHGEMCNITCQDDRFAEDVTKLDAVFCRNGQFHADNRKFDVEYLSNFCEGCDEFKSYDRNYNWDCGIIKDEEGLPQEWCYLQCTINETLSPNLVSIVCQNGDWYNSNV